MAADQWEGIEIQKINGGAHWLVAIVHGWSLYWQEAESIHEFKAQLADYLESNRYLVIENADRRQMIEAVEFMRRRFAYYPIGGISTYMHKAPLGEQLFYVQAIAKQTKS